MDEDDLSLWLARNLSGDELQAQALQCHNALSGSISKVQQHALRVASSLCGKTISPQSLELELASSLATLLPRRDAFAEDASAIAEKFLQAAQAAAQRMDHVSAAHSIAAARNLLGELDAGSSAQAMQAYTSLPGSSAPTPDSVAAPLTSLHERLVHHNTVELQRSCAAGSVLSAERALDALVALLSVDKAAATLAAAIAQATDAALNASVSNCSSPSQAVSAVEAGLVLTISQAAEALAPRCSESQCLYLVGALSGPAFGRIADSLISMQGHTCAPMLVSIAFKMSGALQLGAAKGMRQLVLQELLCLLWRTLAPWLHTSVGSSLRDALQGGVQGELTALRGDTMPRLCDVSGSASFGTHYGSIGGSVRVLSSAAEGGGAIQALLSEGLLDGIEGLRAEIWQELGGTMRGYVHALQQVMKEVCLVGFDQAGQVLLSSLWYILTCVQCAGRGFREAGAVVLELQSGISVCVEAHTAAAMRLLGTSLFTPLSVQLWASNRALLKKDAPMASHSLRHARIMLEANGPRTQGLPTDIAHACTVSLLVDFVPALVGVYSSACPSRSNMALYVTDVNFAVGLIEGLLESVSGGKAMPIEQAKVVILQCDALYALAYLKTAPLHELAALVSQSSIPAMFRTLRDHKDVSADSMELATPDGKARPAADSPKNFLQKISEMSHSDRFPWGSEGPGHGVMRIIFAGNFARNVVRDRPELAKSTFPPLSEEEQAVVSRVQAWLDHRV